MKSIKFFAIGAALLGSVAFTSCTKCARCTGEDAPEVTICRDDYDTEQDYENAIAAAEILGLDCDGAI